MKTPQISANAPRLWQWNFRELHAIRAKLLGDPAEQKQEIQEPLEANGINTTDRATTESDHQLALGLLAYEKDALSEVDAAIQRILSGDYGICEMTGKTIPDARLIAIPWTRYSREAMEIIEQNQSAKLPHLDSVKSNQSH